jgi:hypothetical protein
MMRDHHPENHHTANANGLARRGRATRLVSRPGSHTHCAFFSLRSLLLLAPTVWSARSCPSLSSSRTSWRAVINLSSKSGGYTPSNSPPPRGLYAPSLSADFQSPSAPQTTSRDQCTDRNGPTTASRSWHRHLRSLSGFRCFFHAWLAQGQHSSAQLRTTPHNSTPHQYPHRDALLQRSKRQWPPQRVAKPSRPRGSPSRSTRENRATWRSG